MKKCVIVWFRGLNTHEDSDWCGIKLFLQMLAKFIGAELVGIDYDAPNVENILAELAKRFDVIYAGGHSHGAWRLYSLLLANSTVKVRVGWFLDLAPFFDPFAWQGPSWPKPGNLAKALDFFQTIDTPLRGVRLTEAIDCAVYNVSDGDLFGYPLLHHSDMCGDARVHDRIHVAVADDYSRWMVAEQQNSLPGSGPGPPLQV